MVGRDKPGHDGFVEKPNCSFCFAEKWEGGPPRRFPGTEDAGLSACGDAHLKSRRRRIACVRRPARVTATGFGSDIGFARTTMLMRASVRPFCRWGTDLF